MNINYGAQILINTRDYDQNQGLMFPPHLRDLLPDDHFALILNDVVETLDLSCLYNKVPLEGSPSYHPKMMLKVLIYAYSHGIFSSRKIHQALQDSVAFMYLAAMQRPDFRTINDFRTKNRTEVENLFQQVVDVCKRLGMVSMGHIAIDGSKFKANASDRRTYDKERIEKKIKRLLEQSETTDRQEDQLFGSDSDGHEVPVRIQKQKQRLEHLEKIKEQLKQSGKNRINETDPDAVFMKARKGLTTSYNAQIAVDETHQIIVASDVSNDPSDTDQLIPLVEKTQAALGSIDKLSADSGYSSGENLQKVAEKKIDAYIPDANYQGMKRNKQEAPGGNYFPRSRFIRDEAKDCFICPAGKVLAFWRIQTGKNNEPLRMYRCQSAPQCLMRDQCTKSLHGRSITINAYDKQFRAMRSKLESNYGKRIYSKRKVIAEPVFGHIKEVMGFRKFGLRGLKKVRGEFFLVCIAHNIRKIANALKPRKGLCTAMS